MNENKIIEELKRKGAITPEQEERARAMFNSYKARMNPLSFGACLVASGVDIDNLEQANARVNGRKSGTQNIVGRGSGTQKAVGRGSGKYDAVQPANNERKATLGEVRGVYAKRDAENGTRKMDTLAYHSNKIWRYAGAGLLAAAGLAAGIAGTCYSSGGNSEIERNKVIYRGIDDKNWATKENRDRHIKNLEGFLAEMKSCEKERDSEGAEKYREVIGNYITTVEKKDPDFAKNEKFNSFRAYAGVQGGRK